MKHSKIHGYEDHQKSAWATRAVVGVLEDEYGKNEMKNAFQNVGEVHASAQRLLGVTPKTWKKIHIALQPGDHPDWVRDGHRYVRVGVWADLQGFFTGRIGLIEMPKREDGIADYADFFRNPDKYQSAFDCQPLSDPEIAKLYGIGMNAAKRMRLKKALSKDTPALDTVYPDADGATESQRFKDHALYANTDLSGGMDREPIDIEKELAKPLWSKPATNPYTGKKMPDDTSGNFGGRGNHPYLEDK